MISQGTASLVMLKVLFHKLGKHILNAHFKNQSDSLNSTLLNSDK